MAAPGVGADFAWSHMQRHGWKKGEGLGRRGQGITDALKPKLKFDQAGVGHNRKDEFEFHWWDHVFNSAAQGISVDDSKGEIKVEFNIDKSEISAKKLRKKMQKEIRSKLYANFVKSGTLEGGNFVAEEKVEVVKEVKDLSKLKTMSDDDLVKACGGRTAHKGGRHGHKMTAKLARVEESEKAYLEQLQKQIKAKEEEKLRKKQEREQKHLQSVGPNHSKLLVPAQPLVVPPIQTAEVETASKKKRKSDVSDEDSNEEEKEIKKKKKKKRDIEENNIIENPITSPSEFNIEEENKSKKKKDKDKDNDNTETFTLPVNECDTKKKKKKSKSIDSSIDDTSINMPLESNLDESTKSTKKKKKKGDTVSNDNVANSSNCDNENLAAPTEKVKKKKSKKDKKRDVD
eukprot:TRINITY_DN1606_c0_g1_i1.p1 TRINITY_DN1606_c0_g1~~TRINITY_DN1606_c0_g1_i1.p1  ORF type:complete len:402 (+),score=93.42 TRINITY_DN1606_c0_g1_i1:56-1261(+)